jgi:hypothetical protein
VTYAAAATAALALTATHTELVVSAGPVVLLAVEGGVGGTQATFGAGLMLIPLACGVVNGIAASMLALGAR